MVEIGRRLDAGHLEELLYTATQVRQLLWDGGGTLMHRARANVPHIEVVFLANPESSLRDVLPESDIHLHFVNPQPLYDPERHVRCTLDQFGKLKYLQYGGEWFTVKEVFDFCAYVLGGIHMHDPKNKAEELMLELHQSLALPIKQLVPSPVLMTLDGLIRVAHAALQPLVRALRA
jgi:hypothetical protein